MQLDRRPAPKPNLALLACGVTIAAMWAIIVIALLTFAIGAGSPTGAVRVVIWAAAVIVYLPFLIQFVAAPVVLGLVKVVAPTRRRPAEGRMSALKRRRDQLDTPGRRAYVATWLCAGRRRPPNDPVKGDGQVLAEAKIAEWTAVGAVAIGWPANQELAQKYVEWCGRIDAGCTRRVLLGTTDNRTAA